MAIILHYKEGKPCVCKYCNRLLTPDQSKGGPQWTPNHNFYYHKDLLTLGFIRCSEKREYDIESNIKVLSNA